MKITKTKTYDVKRVCSDNWGMAFGKFISIRVRYNQTVKDFENCFICGHRFSDNEIPGVIAVYNKGNRFACSCCYENV